jgi:glycosyltransferase involved in cell wall biosynthesis
MAEPHAFDVQDRNVLLIGPQVPPYGGMAIQGKLMLDLMSEDGIHARYLATNLPFPKGFEFLDRLRGIRPFLRSAVFCGQLWKLLRDTEVVHILACSWLYFFVIVCPAVLLSKLRGKRVVLNYRGGEADDFFRRSSAFLSPFFRLADIVTAPSNFLVEVIGRRIGVPVQVVPNIVNLNRFVFRERKPLAPKMIVTRHLLKLYDIESVIRAFGLVQQRFPEASLKVVGTGDQEAFLRELVAMLQLRNVEFVGYIPQQNLPELYDRCDILLNASRADNFPGSLVEGAAAGLIVISTKVGGISYIFEHEKSALLVDVGDWQALGAAAIRVLDDPELARRVQREALQQCRRYSWQTIRALLYKVYCFDQPPAASRRPGQAGALKAAVGQARPR